MALILLDDIITGCGLRPGTSNVVTFYRPDQDGPALAAASGYVYAACPEQRRPTIETSPDIPFVPPTTHIEWGGVQFVEVSS